MTADWTVPAWAVLAAVGVVALLALLGALALARSRRRTAAALAAAREDAAALREQVEAIERGMIARARECCGGTESEAARRLGVSRVTLIDKMKKYGLTSRRT